MTKKYHSQLGFTLVEMIVSLAVFAVVITMSVGSLLILIATNQQLQVEQSIMTNLSFALDSMTREIRTGTNYYCDSKNELNSPHTPPAPPADNMFKSGNDLDELGNNTKDCALGIGNNKYHGLSFKEAGDSITGIGIDRILYFYDKDAKTVFRRIGTQDALPVISSGLEIVKADFFVSDTSRTDAKQPTVTIFIEAKEKGSGANAKTYKVQTTVTQRTLDI